MTNNHSDSNHDRLEGNPPSVHNYELDIRGYLDALIEGKFKILLMTMLAIAVAVAYLVFAPPIYSANVLLQFVEKDNLSGALGEASSALVARNSSAAAEVEIIRSRRILGATIDQLNLDISMTPKHLRRDGKIMVESMYSGPEYIGKKLTLKVTGNEQYRLLAPDGDVIQEGRVGSMQADQSPEKPRILISKLNLDQGTELHLTQKPPERSFAELYKKLLIKEVGKSSGVFNMTLEGRNPRLIAETLNSIVDNYLAYTTTRQSEEIEVMIDFVRNETEAARQRLERAEAAQVSFLFSRNSSGLSSEITKLVNRLSDIESQITDLEIQKVGSESKYTANHPVILDLKRKIELLESEKRDIDRRLKRLPEEEREREALLRDVELAKQLYVHLQRKEQELGVALSGIASSLRVIDVARVPVTPVKPKRWVVLAQATLAGLFLGFLFVIARRGMKFSSSG